MNMSTEESVDPIMVEQAQQQIRSLVDEIVGLSRQDIPAERFFPEYLSRVVGALAAVGGAVWTPGENGALELEYHLNFRETRLANSEDDLQSHRQLLQTALKGGQGMLVAPHSGSGGEQGANPTDFLLVLGPLKVGNAVKSVVEIFQRPNPSVKTQAGYLRFLMQMCELASDFLKTRQLQQFTDRQSLWQQLEQFTRSVHASLNPRDVAFTIANEGRRLIQCDRVSVALVKGKKCVIESISGQDTFDARSNTVSLLNQLATTVVAGGEAVWYVGDTSNFPPQIEEAFQAYLDDSHSKHVAVLPLWRPFAAGEGDPRAATANRPPAMPGTPSLPDSNSLPIAALIVEQIEDTRPRDGLTQRVGVVCEHSSTALANALEHEHLFLMPVWRTLGKSRVVLEARNLPKTITVAVCVLLGLIALFLVPSDFNLQSGGTLQPVVRRKVFAGVDGTVDRVLVKHGDQVAPGQVVAELRNEDLMSSIAEVTGKRAEAQEQLLSLSRSEFNEGKQKVTPEERNRMAGERAELRQRLTSLDQQLELYNDKRQMLHVVTPIGGEVTTWDVEQLLKTRPVHQGDALIDVADTSGQWELELRMPEDRVGHLLEAQHDPDLGQELKVTYRLATDPGMDHEGTVVEVHKSAEVHGEEGNVVLVRVAIDKSKLSYLRPGADVMAKVHCGRASLGYCWFHDAIAFLQSKVLFKL
jgi:hypothetical protein